LPIEILPWSGFDTAPTLAVADALHAHSADAVTLVSDSWLAVADARHAHAADNVVLSGDGIVAPAAAAARTYTPPGELRIHAAPTEVRTHTPAAQTRIWRATA
jgi:hypothetical protein